MKKVIKFVLPLVLFLSSCGTMNLKKDTTVILDVESEVTPTFAANFGEGSYTNNTYTHHITAQKDLYIYMSYEGLATETVYVPAKEMTESVIRKSVQFGNPLKSIVTIDADNIEDISKAKVETEAEILNTRYDDNNKNKMKITFAGRDKDIDLVFKADDYRDTKIHIDKSYLRSGLYTARPVFLKSDQVAVSVTNASATIYEYPSGDKVREIWSNEQTTNYIIKDNTKTYYVKYYDQVDGIEKINLVDKTDGLTIELPLNQSNNQQYLGNFRLNIINSKGEQNEIGYKCYIDMKNHTLYNAWGLYQEHLQGGFGVVFQYSEYNEETWSYESKIYRIPELSAIEMDKVVDEYKNATYTATVRLSDLEVINSEIKFYDVLHKDKLLRTETNSLSFNGNFKEFDYDEATKTIKYEFYTFDYTSKVVFDIVSEKGEFLTHYEGTLNSLTVNRDLIINKKSRNVRVDLIFELLNYDEATNTYTFPDAVVDTSVNYVRVRDISHGGDFYVVSVYDHDLKKELKVKENASFEAVVGHKYTIAGYEYSYAITATENDIQSGYILVGGTPTEIKLPSITGWEIEPTTKGYSGNVLYELDNGDKYLRNIERANADFMARFLITDGEISLLYSQYYQNKEAADAGLVDLTPRFWFNYGNMDSVFGTYSKIEGESEYDYQSYSSFYRYPLRQLNDDDIVATFNNKDNSDIITIYASDFIYIEEYGCKVLNPAKYRFVTVEGFDMQFAGLGNIYYDSFYWHQEQDFHFGIMKVEDSFEVGGAPRSVTEVDGLFVRFVGTVEWDEMADQNKLKTLAISNIPFANIPKTQNNYY